MQLPCLLAVEMTETGTGRAGIVCTVPMIQDDPVLTVHCGGTGRWSMVGPNEGRREDEPAGPARGNGATPEHHHHHQLIQGTHRILTYIGAQGMPPNLGARSLDEGPALRDQTRPAGPGHMERPARTSKAG